MDKYNEKGELDPNGEFDKNGNKIIVEDGDKTIKTEINPLDMPDDEFDNISLTDLDDLDNKDDSDKDDDDSDKNKDKDDDTDKDVDDDSNDKDVDEDKDKDDLDDDLSKDDDKDIDKSIDDKDDTSKEDDNKDDKSTKEGVDSETELKKLFAPFRANGKEMQIDNVEDAIHLMQMGANYNKKMAGLKPNLKLIKMLENNDLLDEGKLSYLIDLNKKNPEAIKKLIKDSGIDVDDINTDDDKESEYKPNTYTVDDGEIELDNVISEIKDSPAFKKTMDIVGNKWDEPSKQVLAGSPGIIKVINEHVELGVYDKIMVIVERDRMLGKLKGLSDLQAYKMVGDAVNANGGFKTAPKKTDDSTTIKDDDNKSKKDKERKDRKKSASSTKSSSNKKPAKETYNPLDLPDDEFEKIATSKYM